MWNKQRDSYKLRRNAMENGKVSNVVFNSVLNETIIITLANHKDHTESKEQSKEPINTQSKYSRSLQKGRENVCQ